MATDPKSKGKQLNKEQEKEKKRKALDEATKQKPAKKTSSEKGRTQEKEKAPKKGRRRVLPIWLRIIFVLLFSVAALLIGLMVGYGVIGDGNPTNALKMDTWQHIWNIVMKTE
ncbi:DNA-directed RNA polymerase subunit beta [Halobacillus karajensis]|uniref:DNA-directed RNA polymerase subunit beta n=1 Tax=Halobacillus karajensis TaxID=195088 RepID=A0A024P513_9BACI|nr:DNA-directed RNA polymerase subunit beta [Halobacillus karajensis]CDQ18850.1 DNA-directed RNA polymerase subunit beta [Halobacillus karajensis]CDQ23077.1 DNA-directed RNA polymerase subunit beta [Halobacillus karajensis]CDQ26559.1 DNA-directed RNA polymerase subunit beta [Halobacillus karajensis]SEH45250.1 DNA-directed RNA polymerase subunit beta [Halobacillus karajensis]